MATVSNYQGCRGESHDDEGDLVDRFDISEATIKGEPAFEMEVESPMGCAVAVIPIDECRDIVAFMNERILKHDAKQKRKKRAADK
jgi:hypothetical protein